MPITVTASFRLEWTESPKSKPERPPVSPEKAPESSSTMPIYPGWCPECKKYTCFSGDWNRKGPVPHAWTCGNCDFRWTHDGAYLEEGPETTPAPHSQDDAYEEDPTGYVECANCREPVAFLIDSGGPMAAPFHYECPGCNGQFFLDQPAPVIPEDEPEETDEPAPEKPAEPVRAWPCPACGRPETDCTNSADPVQDPRRWRCRICAHHFRVSDGWEEGE